MRLLPDNPQIAWTPYVNLVYLGFFLMQPVLWPQVPHERALSAVVVALFLVCYFRSFWLRGWRLLGPIAGMVALGMWAAQWNVGANTFFIYAGASAAFVGPPTRAMLVLVSILSAPMAAAMTYQHTPYFWGPALLFTPIVGALNIHHRSNLLAEAKLRQSREEISHLAKIAERERIARDLHDLLGHTLSTITLKAELAARLAGTEPDRARSEMRDVERISRHATREIRAAVTGYRTRTLGDEVVRVREALDAAEVAFEMEDAPGDPLPPLVEGVLALALREAVTNIVRHAGATTCRVEVTQDGTSVRLLVEDDGKGVRGPEGAGLTGMRERVESLGGTAERSGGEGRSAEHCGTRLVVTIPVVSETRIEPTEGSL